MAKTKIYFSEKYKTLPDASKNDGKIVQYSGTNTDTYKTGYFYKSVNGGWVASDTQAYPIVDKKTLIRTRNASSSTRKEASGIGLIMWCPEMTPNLGPGSVITALSLDAVVDVDVTSGKFRMVLWSNDGGDHDSTHNKLIGWSKDLNSLAKGELLSTTWTFANVVVPNTFKRLIIQLEPEDVSVDTIKNFVWGTQNTYSNLSVAYDDISGDDGNQFLNTNRCAYQWGVVARGSVTSYATSVVGQSDIDTAVAQESDFRVAGDKVFTDWRDNSTVILGEGTTTEGDAIAIGSNASASDNGISIGSSISTASSGISIGNNSNADSKSIVIGSGSIVESGENVVIGNNATTSSDITGSQNSVAIGNCAYAPSGEYVLGTTSTPKTFYFNSKCERDIDSGTLKPTSGAYTLEDYLTKTAILTGTNDNKQFNVQKYINKVEFNDTDVNATLDKVRYFEVPVNHPIDSRIVQLAIYGGVEISYTDPVKLVLWDYNGSGAIDDTTCKFIGCSENSASIKSYYGNVFYFNTPNYGLLLKANHKLIVQGIPESETPDDTWIWSEKSESFEHLSLLIKYDETQQDETLKGWSVTDINGIADYTRPCGVFGFYALDNVSISPSSVSITSVKTSYNGDIDALNSALIVNGTGVGDIIKTDLLGGYTIDDLAKSKDVIFKGNNTGNATITLSSDDGTNQHSTLTSSEIDFSNGSTDVKATISTVDSQYKSFGSGVGTVISNYVHDSMSSDYSFASGSTRNGNCNCFGISSNIFTDSVINEITINAPASISYNNPIKLVLWSYDGSGNYTDDSVSYIGCSNISALLTANSSTTFTFDGVIIEAGYSLIVQGVYETEIPDASWKWSEKSSTTITLSVKYMPDEDTLNTLGTTSGYLIECLINATPKTKQILKSIPKATDLSYGVVKTDGINGTLTSLSHEYTFGSHGANGDRFAVVQYAILSIPNTYLFAGNIIRSISIMASSDITVDNVKKLVLWETTNPYSLSDSTVRYVGVSSDANRQTKNSFSTWNFDNLQITRGSALIIQGIAETVVPNNNWKWSERSGVYKCISCRSEADTGANGNIISGMNHILYCRINVVKDAVVNNSMLDILHGAIGSTKQSFGTDGSAEFTNSRYAVISVDNTTAFAGKPIYSITITAGSSVANDVFKKLVIWECSNTSSLSNITCKPLGVSTDVHKQVASGSTTWKFSGEMVTQGKALIIQGVDANILFDNSWTWDSRSGSYECISIKYDSSISNGNEINHNGTLSNGLICATIDTLGVAAQQSAVAVVTNNYTTTDESGYKLTIN